MSEMVQNPMFKCSKCGKQVKQGGVATGIPDYWICLECRGKMKKLTITRTIYEDGYAEVAGNCDFCNQYPCLHGDPSGDFAGLDGNAVMHVSADLCKRWLGKT